MWLLLLSLMGCERVYEAVRPRVTTEHLERLCQTAARVDLGDLDKAGRLKVITDQIDEEAIWGLKQTWRTVTMAPPEVRREVYRELLREAGHPDFSCEPLERVILAE